MAASAAVQEAVFLRELLKSMGLPQTEATVIKEDNQAAIALSKNPVTSKRTKHIDIRCHFVREKTESGQIVLEYISTKEQVADLLTKSIAIAGFNELRSKLVG